MDTLYVDAVHYSPRMADWVAHCARDAMHARGQIPSG
jgi:hypothetical protein